ncbi:MAG: PDZ domain-containing protein [Bacteroidales bacterium]|nr:PDZ domain-containing protein [Bacteroidales bacterium]
MNSKKYQPLQVIFIFILGLLVGKFCFSTNKDKVEFSLFNGKPSKLQTVINLIDDRYVDDIDVDSLTELIIPDIFSKLDPHTKYYSAEKRTDVERNIIGHFCGVGIEFNVSNDTCIALSIVKDGPCDLAGILAGDNILKIDTVDVVGSNAKNLVSNLMKGEEGSVVQVTVHRQGIDSALVFDVVRGDIPTYSVPAGYKLDSVTGYIKITSFGDRTYKEFVGKLKPLLDSGIQNLIVDLRDNGGGLLYTVRDIVSEILHTNDTIVYTEERHKDRSLVLIDTVSNPICKDLNVICIVNSNSASASEIMVGAIQDHDRGIILGRRTFGKGLVQTPISFQDNSVVRLTTSRYYTPSGRSFQKAYSEYDNDLKKRLKNGELDSANAFSYKDSTVYFTKHGRKVYAGGGVMPDYFVPYSYQFSNGLLYKLDSAQLFYKFASRKYNLMAEKDTTIRNSDKYVTELFSDETKLLDDFISFAASYNVKINPRKDKKELQDSKKLILSQIMAYCYHVVGDEDNYYKYYNFYNADVVAAERLFGDINTFNLLLGANENN